MLYRVHEQEQNEEEKNRHRSPRGRLRGRCHAPRHAAPETYSVQSLARAYQQLAADLLARLVQVLHCSPLPAAPRPAPILEHKAGLAQKKSAIDHGIGPSLLLDWTLEVAIMVGLRKRGKQPEAPPTTVASAPPLDKIDEILQLDFGRLNLDDKANDARLAMIHGGGPITRARARAVADLILNDAVRTDVVSSSQSSHAVGSSTQTTSQDYFSTSTPSVEPDSGTFVFRQTPIGGLGGSKSALAQLKRENKQVEKDWMEAQTAALQSMPPPSLVTVEKAATSRLYLEQHFRDVFASPPTGSMEGSGELRLSRTRLDARSFVKVKTLGRGAFGVVSLVHDRKTAELLAMKRIDKVEMIRMCQAGHVKAERDVLAKAAAAGSKYIARLVSSFQGELLA